MHATADAARRTQLRITIPAAPWQRRAFNGHAQLIVQATRDPGLAQVTIISPSLQQAIVRLRSEGGALNAISSRAGSCRWVCLQDSHHP
jgi:hypothetical protein